MESGGPRTFAILIDADHADEGLVNRVMEEVEKRGIARVRIVIGSPATLRGLNRSLSAHGFEKQEQAKVANKKNAGDIALTIRAMDLLRDARIDSICIVSRDSDFQPLAKRLQKDGRYVLGMSREIPADAWRQACDEYVALADSGSSASHEVPPDVKDLLIRTYNQIKGNEDWVHLSALSDAVRSQRPGFDPHNYGRTQLWMLARDSGFEIRPDTPAGAGRPVFVRPRPGA